MRSAGASESQNFPDRRVSCVSTGVDISRCVGASSGAHMPSLPICRSSRFRTWAGPRQINMQIPEVGYSPSRDLCRTAIGSWNFRWGADSLVKETMWWRRNDVIVTGFFSLPADPSALPIMMESLATLPSELEAGWVVTVFLLLSIGSIACSSDTFCVPWRFRKVVWMN